MTKPVRLQLKRTKGFRLQEASQAVNGLPAIIVGRPTKWGNPWRIMPIDGRYIVNTAFDGRHVIARNVIPFQHRENAAIWVVTCFEVAVREGRISAFTSDDVASLAGKNLACWCDLSMPCHADVLLRLANPEEVSNVQG